MKAYAGIGSRHAGTRHDHLYFIHDDTPPEPREADIARAERDRMVQDQLGVQGGR